MRVSRSTLAASALPLATYSASLQSVCTPSNVKNALPHGVAHGITLDDTSVTANAVYNTSVSDETFFPDATFDYCNVTLAYSHAGKDDQVLLEIWLPAPEKFQNRWLSTGGGGFAINGQGSSLPGGVMYGAAAGQTDGGFGGFSNQLDSQTPLANGTANLDAIYMFGYQAIHELGVIGKAFTRNFFNVADNSKVYAYYQGCSEGGRDGWSQAQRFDDLDGLIIGAPAMRYGQQQTNHLYADVVEKTMDYYPPTCELEKIMNLTISACDALDGKKDGVVSRTDLCKLNFNINSTIGHPYSCAASTTSMQLRKRVGMTNTTPAQNGTVTRQGAAVAAKMLEGLHDSQGRRAYIWYQPSASFDDAQTKYNSETDSWELSITSLGGEWVTRFLELNTADNLSSLENVTYDTLRDWMQLGWDRYADVLQTNNPDLTNFQKSGGKILHFHGESDPSIPAGSSVHYHESVRNVMYPGLSYSDSTDALADWYRLYLVPGAAHCSPSTSQPNGPFPQTNLAVMIDWVENGKTPTTLNATVLDGANKGKKGEICAWPLRPVWEGDDMKCVYHQESIDTWKYEFDAYKVPLY